MKLSKFHHLSSFTMLYLMGFFAIFSSTLSKSPVLPLFAQYLGATEAIIGLIAASSTIIGILISVPGGVLSDVLGRRKVILIAAVIFSSAPFLYLAVSSAWHLVLVRVYHGMATAIFGPVVLALIADFDEKRRGESMGWYTSSTLVGRAVAPFAGGFLLTLFAVSSFWHFRLVYVLAGLAGALALLLVFRLPQQERIVGPAPDSREAAPESSASHSRFHEMLGGLSTIVRHKGILATSLCEAVQYFGYGAFEVFLPLYAQKVGISGGLIGVLLGTHVLALTLSRPFMGRISDTYGRKPQIILGLAAGALGMTAMPFFEPFWALLLISLMLGLGMSAVTASTGAMVADQAKGAFGSALGIMSAIMDIGHSLGPIVAGLIISAFDYRTAYIAVACVFLLTAVIFPLLVGAVGMPNQEE